ncbi:hypothetical protein GOTRE_038_00040 [Gordonia terrae NBRC 100016]|uniref:Uncharacterized protein n=1 Tax=Gordonia terrae NBRC 100016 TaxID=1089454 RepID=A0ABQ0HB45_9ACTN|nr:hypothetical protein GOTRE_038_00040 [Gordonia terrae NBRC 100016]VTR09809.1 Uncharacterised protein [Clostridioides difficile]
MTRCFHSLIIAKCVAVESYSGTLDASGNNSEQKSRPFQMRPLARPWARSQAKGSVLVERSRYVLSVAAGKGHVGGGAELAVPRMSGGVIRVSRKG